MAPHESGGLPTPVGESLLRTSGELALTFIGTGSAFSKKLFQNNILIAKGSEHVLVDCGSRTPEALDLLGLSVTKIGNYLVTHGHADHIGGLEEVMLVNRYMAKKKTRMIVSDKMKNLIWNQSLRGGAAWNERHDGQELTFDDFWIQERPRRVKNADRELSEVKIGDLQLHLFRTMHIPDSAVSWEDSLQSVGIIIDRRILFTGDTRFDPDLITWAETNFPLEMIFHDVQMFTGGVHAGIDQLGTLPVSTKAKILLMHYGDRGLEARDKAMALGFAGFAEQWKTYRYP
ncbi:MAG: MBL fold metallo-hydrolase [Spirochaetota bacterium]